MGDTGFVRSPDFSLNPDELDFGGAPDGALDLQFLEILYLTITSWPHLSDRQRRSLVGTVSRLPFMSVSSRIEAGCQGSRLSATFPSKNPLHESIRLLEAPGGFFEGKDCLDGLTRCDTGDREGQAGELPAIQISKGVSDEST
ncbi:MAG TPA: hypothetical protein PK402_12190 [Tepidisphaeraceae bacterium]|nr:hypothetical protein [Tepidisphaeraceae bacterium]